MQDLASLFWMVSGAVKGLMQSILVRLELLFLECLNIAILACLED